MIGRARATLVVAGLAGILAPVRGQDLEREPGAFFEARVRPVLAGTCVKCHGASKVSGGLRLDSRDALLRGGDSGPAVELGDPEASLLVQAIRHADDALKMPPNGPLPKGAVNDLAAWVAAGAPWPEGGASATLDAEQHWAFQPLADNEPPADPSGWADAPIDRLIAAEHRARGLTPVAPADRRTLIRRATFDLLGLPPSPERVEAFVADGRPDAFERLVEELLAAPQYGERWGRYWLDLARYADTAGDNSDYPVPEAYLYRDYVIDAFNADVPYDRFLHEQLAGDILAREGPDEDYTRRVIATGFIAQAKRFGTFKLEDIHQIIEDSLNTTGQVVLGLSLRCARCHDHKFDPITARDYYALYGVFASTRYPFAGAEEERQPSEFAPLIVPAEVEAREARHAEAVALLKAELQKAEAASDLGRQLAELNRRIADAEQRLKAGCDAATSEALQRDIDAWKAEQARVKELFDAQLKPRRTALARAEKRSPLEGVPVAYAVREGKPTDAAIQIGGDPKKLGDVVARGVPKVLEPDADLAIPDGASGRLELARWLTGPAAPLSARVMVNRIWQHHFGKPIVATPSDFGLRGTPPTHPALLDYLARRFIADGWSIKAMHRRIMLSKTYQLACVDEPGDDAIDSGNAWYWRADRRPLDAEALRDALLALGGTLDLSRPGPHPFPPKEKWRYTAHHQFKALYDSDHRSVYLMVQRLHPHPYLKLFNGPDTSTTTAVRDDASVPLQALYLLNNPLVHRQAEGFARTLIARAPDLESRIRLAYMLAFARPPTEPEQARALDFLARYERSLDADGSPPEGRAPAAWAALARALLASNEFLFVD